MRTGTGRLLTALLIPAAILVAYAGRSANFGYFFNSDLVQGFMVGEALFAEPRSLLDWYHPSALFVFPDWLLAGAMAIAWPGSDRLLPLLYATMLLAAYAAAGAVLLQQTTTLPVRSAAWLFAAVAAVAAYAAPAPAGSAMSSFWLFVTSSSGYIHTGALLLTLVSASLLMMVLRDGSPAPAWLLIGLCAATAFSDALFIVWFVAPAVVVLLLAARVRRTSSLVHLALMLSAAVTLARLGEPILRGGSSLAALDRVAPWVAVRLFAGDVKTAIVHGDAGFMLLSLLVPVILVRGAVIATAMLRGRAQSLTALSELFLAGSIGAALSAPLVSGLYKEVWLMRYCLVVPVLVVTWTLQAVAAHASTRTRRSIVYVGVAVTLLVGAASSRPAWLNVQELQRPSPLESCLTELGRDTGIGDYWSAKGLMFESERRIHVIQVDAAGAPFRVNYNRQWFHRHAGTGAPLRPDFIIMARLDPVQIEKRFSRPQAVADCAGQQIWLYEKPVDFRPD